MRRFLTWALLACLAITPMAAQSQSAAVQILLKAKPPGCFPTAGKLFDLDPAKRDTLSQTISGTTAVSADGDLVGTARNALGDGFDLTATADTAVRPTYNTDGLGHWLTFTTGENDVLRRTAALGLFGGTSRPVTIVAVVRAVATTQTSIVGEGSSSTGTPHYSVTRTNGTDFNDLQANYVQDSGTIGLNNIILFDEAFPADTDSVIVITDTSASILAYYDGTANPGGATSYTRGTTTLDRFSVGARVRTTTDGYFVGRIYRLIIYNRVLSAGEIARSTVCGKALQGR